MLNKLNKMMESGGLTSYLYNYCKNRIQSLPLDMQHQMLTEASIMSDIGVESEDDHKHFLYITMHLKPIAKNIANGLLSTEQLAKLSSVVYEDRHMYPIDTILNFYKTVNRAMNTLQFSIKKNAYPVGLGGGQYPDSPYDMTKWLQAMRDIYVAVHRGLNNTQAFNKVTAGWSVVEQQNFKTWQRFYTEGTQYKYNTANVNSRLISKPYNIANWDTMEQKNFKTWQKFYTNDKSYKTAQISDYYQAEDGSPLLPFNDLKYHMPGIHNTIELPTHIEDEKKKREEARALKEEQKRLDIEDARQKVISRLTSAERIVTRQPNIDKALGMGLDEWLKMLHALKRSVQTAIMSSDASPILEDIIIRRGNQLTHNGYVKSGKLLISLALDSASEQPSEQPSVSSTNNSENLDAPDDINSPDIGDIPPDIELTQEDMSEESDEENSAMSDFVRLLNHEHLDDSDLDDELMVEAQAVLPQTTVNTQNVIPSPNTPKVLREEPHDVEVDEIADLPEQGDTLDTALEGITIEDVIDRLELVSNIIQNREIPRQLSFADMQMGKLGIATFFPNLGESIRSALESHQYIYTRIEDIISKLRGSIQPTQEIDLTSDKKSEQATSSTLDAIRQKLTQSEEEEKQRSKTRKEKREKKELSPTPQPPITPTKPPLEPNEIAGPVEVESAPPTRIT